MNVPLLDLSRQYAAIKDEIQAAVLEVFESQQFILGPKVRQCEETIAAYVQCKHGVGVSSGSDALLMCLMAEEIGPGDEVLTTPFTFFATAGAIARVGAVPVFVDIVPATYNLDPAQIERKISQRTKAIIPVHLYGQCAPMDPILQIAKRHGLTVIEDAAQAIGAEYKGRRAGSMGHYGCLSFFPSKNLGCAGDGGMITTQDDDRAERLRVLRAHGSNPKYFHQRIGGNFRLDSLQAAVLQVKTRYLDAWCEARRANARYYDRAFRGTRITTPSIDPDCVSVYNQYVIRVPRRNELVRFLKTRHIGCEIYYPLPLHLQECFRYCGQQKGSLPNAEQAAEEVLAIPVYPELTDAMKNTVVKAILDFLEWNN